MLTMRVRAPAVAGLFYPQRPQELAAAVKSYLAGAKATASGRVGEPVARAIVAPHAGYLYSGAIAGAAYASLAMAAHGVTRIVVMGPSHRLAFRGLATCTAAAFESPLGPLHVDREAVARLTESGLARELDVAHANEHSLEVQLPFLKHLFPEAHIVPILTGDEAWQPAAQAIELLWQDEATALVVSSDLSHYHDYPTAQAADARTAAQLEALAAGEIDHRQACGATAINALLAVAARKGLSCATRDLRNSGDTAGPRDRVVGYGAFILA